MRLIVLLLVSLKAFIELSGASILDRLEKYDVYRTILMDDDKCIEKGSALDHEFWRSIDDYNIDCKVPDAPYEYGEYMYLDHITGQITCKYDAAKKCEYAVKEMGKVLLKAFVKVPDPFICPEYQFFLHWNFESCN